MSNAVVMERVSASGAVSFSDKNGREEGEREEGRVRRAGAGARAG